MAARAEPLLAAGAGDSEPGPVRALPGPGRPEQRGRSSGRVLVLNASFEPINVCTVRRAAVLILKNRAEVLEHGEWALHAESLTLPRPVVIRLLTYVRIPRDAHRRKITRRAVFARDRWTCQYCGHERGNLTVDHVIPRSKGGSSSWDNIVTCCAPCNRRKGDRLPRQANMVPARKPRAPQLHGLHPRGHARPSRRPGSSTWWPPDGRWPLGGRRRGRPVLPSRHPAPPAAPPPPPSRAAGAAHPEPPARTAPRRPPRPPPPRRSRRRPRRRRPAPPPPVRLRAVAARATAPPPAVRGPRRAPPPAASAGAPPAAGDRPRRPTATDRPPPSAELRSLRRWLVVAAVWAVAATAIAVLAFLTASDDDDAAARRREHQTRSDPAAASNRAGRPARRRGVDGLPSVDGDRRPRRAGRRSSGRGRRLARIEQLISAARQLRTISSDRIGRRRASGRRGRAAGGTDTDAAPVARRGAVNDEGRPAGAPRSAAGLNRRRHCDRRDHSRPRHRRCPGWTPLGHGAQLRS